MKYEIQSGLPPYGPEAIWFSDTGWGQATEGLVIKFMPDRSESWIGNFIRGMSQFDKVYYHPDFIHIVVIAGGTGYVVCPEKKKKEGSFGADITGGFEFTKQRKLALHTTTDFYIADSHGEIRRTQRIALDGIRNIECTDIRLTGEAYDLEGWKPFEMNIETEVITGDGQPFRF
jgi:hypothetical protein